MELDPEGRWPTPTEWFMKVLALDLPERNAHIAHVLRDLQTAEACYVMNHRRRLEGLEREKRELTETLANMCKDLDTESERERLSRRVRFLEDELRAATEREADERERARLAEQDEFNFEGRAKRAEADLKEMTRLRDNALRQAEHADQSIDVDLEGTVEDALAAMGWEWESTGDDSPPDELVQTIVGALRPIVAHATKRAEAAEKGISDEH